MTVSVDATGEVQLMSNIPVSSTRNLKDSYPHVGAKASCFIAVWLLSWAFKILAHCVPCIRRVQNISYANADASGLPLSSSRSLQRYMSLTAITSARPTLAMNASTAAAASAGVRLINVEARSGKASPRSMRMASALM